MGEDCPHALFSLQEVLNRQYQLQDQEQAIATRAHPATLTSVRSGSEQVLRITCAPHYSTQHRPSSLSLLVGSMK